MIATICAVICVVLAVLSMSISAMSYWEQGFLFHNAYIWASPEERAAMNKKPFYRQAAIAFAMVTAIFLCMAGEFLLQTGWFWAVIGLLCLVLLVYVLKTSPAAKG